MSAILGPTAPRANRIGAVAGVALGNLALLVASFLRSPVITLAFMWMVIAFAGALAITRALINVTQAYLRGAQNG